MTATKDPTGAPLAARIELTGRVQGVGLRPAVARLAQSLSLAGCVRNTRRGVELLVEGNASSVERFERELSQHLPAGAAIASRRDERVPPAGFASFLLDAQPATTAQPATPAQPATTAPSRGVPPPPDSQPAPLLSAVAPPDVAVCSECLADIQDRASPRHRYALTSCAACGPRYSVIERMPYQREQTSLAAFDLCARCRREYASPSDRRYHAQSIACPQCGPQIWLAAPDGRAVAHGAESINAAAAALREGRIVALRGLGGYQLLVDASSRDAVERLRRRKGRRAKPLAVMTFSLVEAERLARLEEADRRELCDPAGPIVVAVAREGAPLANSIAGGLGTIGLMLPTTPLHWLLLKSAGRAVVCTSGNLEGDPLACDAAAAARDLGDIADLFLEHDRPIRRPIDDSVVRIMAGRAVTIRLARGLAPLPLSLPSAAPRLALGGHQKAAVALCNGGQSILAPHLGDLDTVAARRRFVEQAADLSDLYGVEHGPLVCDRHPEYFTTQWADEWADGEHQAGGPPRPVVRVQHHHTHIAACMLEHGWLDRQVLGFAFDGTGYGDDGTIWGGEVLRCTAAACERVAHLRPFALAGGERAIREPWRVATALVRDALGDDAAARLRFQSADARQLLPVLRRPGLAFRTTSAGRLFDGVAALIMGLERCDFEGQAAMLLESICDASAPGQYAIPIRRGRPRQLDWRPLVRRLCKDRAVGESPAAMAMRFHRAVADAIVECCRLDAPLPVALGGGVFQNRVLVELLAERFAGSPQPLGLPGRIPPNDGGLAAGQLAITAAQDEGDRLCA